MGFALKIGDRFAKNLLAAADRLRELGRSESEYALLQAAADKGTAKHLRRLLAHAEQKADIETARQVLPQLIEQLQQTEKPAAVRELVKLRGSDLFLLNVLDDLGAPENPISPSAGRLLYIVHHSRPYLTNGYASRSHGLATGMLRAGIDVVCLTRPGFPLDVKKDLENVPTEDEIEGVTYLRDLAPIRSGPARSRTYILDAAAVVEDRIRKHRPQAVMVASNYVAAAPALIAARRTGVPIAYEVRGFWEVTEASRDPALQGSYSNLLKTRIESLIACLSDQVFTLSRSMAHELARRGVASEQIALLPNACNPEEFRPLPKDLRLAAKYNIPTATPVIGYIGSFVGYEGLDDLTVACAKLKAAGYQFRLLLVGASEGPVHDQLVKIADDSGLRDWLILPGRVPHEDVSRFYSLIDIAPFPRKPLPVTELVTPIKPLEAMAMEKAVVMSSVGALADMIDDGITGLIFQKGDVNDLARCLARLFEEPALLAYLGHNARKFVQIERTWTGMGERVADWLKRI